MAGMSGMMVNGGLAYADRWPPMVLPLGLYRAAEEDDIPEKWRNLARHARKRRTRKVTSREGRVSRNPLGLHETAEEDKSRPARDV